MPRHATLSSASHAPEAAVVKTAGRVFEVLELFGETKRPLSAREIASHLGYPASSTAALLRSISTLGYLSYSQHTRTYFPSLRLPLLGDWVFDALFNGGELVPLANEVAARTLQTGILAVENDIYAQYVHVSPSPNPVQFFIQPGARRLLCKSGTGWAILSQQPDEAIRRIVHKTKLRLGASVQDVSVGWVLARVDETRKQGYASVRNIITPGVGIIAMPLQPDAATGGRLALAAGGLVERLDAEERQIADVLRQCIERFSGLTMTKYERQGDPQC